LGRMRGGDGRGDGGEAAGYEGVADRVHEVEEAGWAVGIPPAAGEGVEVGDFGWVDGGGGGVAEGDMVELGR
jgi:hypothetical protein